MPLTTGTRLSPYNFSTLCRRQREGRESLWWSQFKDHADMRAITGSTPPERRRRHRMSATWMPTSQVECRSLFSSSVSIRRLPWQGRFPPYNHSASTSVCPRSRAPASARTRSPGCECIGIVIRPRRAARRKIDRVQNAGQRQRVEPRNLRSVDLCIADEGRKGGKGRRGT